MKKNNMGFVAECIATAVAYGSLMIYGYKLSFGWLGKILRKEMSISEYIKKAIPTSIIFGCIGWCIGRNIENLMVEHYQIESDNEKLEETDIQ